MDVESLTVNISRAFDELRSIDDSITALAGRDRFGGVRRRISDGGPRNDNFQAADRVDSRREVRTVSMGGMGSVNKRRLVVSADNDLYDGVPDKRARGRDEDVEESRRKVQSSIVMPAIETKSREAAISELKGTQKKEVSTRNRRMFSNLLLGTLQRFQKDEKKVLSTEKVQAEKQKEVERRLRATEVEEKERLAKERQELFEQRREKERLIKALQRKKAIIQYAEQKQEHYRKLQGFIQTQAKPPLFYLPAKHTLITLELLKNSAKKIDGLIERRRQQMEAEMKSPEERAREAETSNGQDMDVDQQTAEGSSSTKKSAVKKETTKKMNGEVKKEEEEEDQEHKMEEDHGMEEDDKGDKDHENDQSRSSEDGQKTDEKAGNDHSRSSEDDHKETADAKVLDKEGDMDSDKDDNDNEHSRSSNEDDGDDDDDASMAEGSDEDKQAAGSSDEEEEEKERGGGGEADRAGKEENDKQ